jgi:hypothetical protein
MLQGSDVGVLANYLLYRKTLLHFLSLQADADEKRSTALGKQRVPGLARVKKNLRGKGHVSTRGAAMRLKTAVGEQSGKMNAQHTSASARRILLS